jgi:hypothetical protein
VIWRLRELLFEHFSGDERGRVRSLRFLTWHLNFLCRYQAFPEDEFAAQSREHPLLQTRMPGEPASSPLEALLRDGRAETHAALAALIIDSADREEALGRALDLQESLPPAGDAGELEVAAAEVSG